MKRFIVRRFLYMILTVWVITLISFIVIQLPPGDYVSDLVTRIVGQGADEVPPEVIAQLRAQYGLDQPIYVQYLKWLRNVFLDGDFGYSFTRSSPSACP
jgi:peptide/nickel transport system permease protein